MTKKHINLEISMMHLEYIYVNIDEIKNYINRTKSEDILAIDVIKIKKFLQDYMSSAITMNENNIQRIQYDMDNLQRRIGDLEKTNKIFETLMKQINDNDMLKTEWERFMFFVKLSATPLEDK